MNSGHEWGVTHIPEILRKLPDILLFEDGDPADTIWGLPKVVPLHLFQQESKTFREIGTEVAQDLIGNLQTSEAFSKCWNKHETFSIVF